MAKGQRPEFPWVELHVAAEVLLSSHLPTRRRDLPLALQRRQVSKCLAPYVRAAVGVLFFRPVREFRQRHQTGAYADK